MWLSHSPGSTQSETVGFEHHAALLEWCTEDAPVLLAFATQLARRREKSGRRQLSGHFRKLGEMYNRPTSADKEENQPTLFFLIARSQPSRLASQKPSLPESQLEASQKAIPPSLSFNCQKPEKASQPKIQPTKKASQEEPARVPLSATCLQASFLPALEPRQSADVGASTPSAPLKTQVALMFLKLVRFVPARHCSRHMA